MVHNADTEESTAAGINTERPEAVEAPPSEMPSSPIDDLASSVSLNAHPLLHHATGEKHEESFDDATSDIALSDDGDTASQRSIALSSPPRSPRHSASSAAGHHPNEETSSAIAQINLVRESLSFSKRNTMDTVFSSEVDDDRSLFTQRLDEGESPISSVAPSVNEIEKSPVLDAGPSSSPIVSTPPSRQSDVPSRSDTESLASFTSEATSYSRKARPESLLPQAMQGPLVLGIALVDFDHMVGPKIEFSRGDIFEDEEIAKILPFLALPDGAHLTSEDYSYFHLVPSSPNPSTVFGISCNRQISTSELLVRDADMTRSTVQKAVVVLASKPVFGLIRDRLGVITRALFAQRDFSDMSILDDFHTSLERSLRSQMTESGLYMGTSLRELVHTFRQRTLVLLKALMLQKKIMFFGHPVERLCTYQYSLITLVPGLLQNLEDCGSPPLATRAQTLSRPTSLRTSDPKSVMAYVGLPLDLFGKDAFFQPYLPLQQLDMLKDTQGWLCGSTNTIVTQQKEVDVLVNIETGTTEFRDSKLERVTGLTPADRKWIDDIVKDVNETFVEDPTLPLGMHFKGSDDYLREKFNEYISGALASVKYAAFLSKAHGGGVLIMDGAGDPNSAQDFNPFWIQEFKKTNVYEVWERVTDPMLFDIVEARHPCSEKPSVVSDIGLRLSEGIQELKLDQQLAPTREAISRTFAVGSTNLFKAVEGVRSRWASRTTSSSSSGQNTPMASATTSTDSSAGTTSTSSSADDMNKADTSVDSSSSPGPALGQLRRGTSDGPQPTKRQSGLRPLSMAMTHPVPPPPPEPTRFSGWVGSFFAQRASRASMASSSSRPTSGTGSLSQSPRNSTPVATPPPLPARDSMSNASVTESMRLHEQKLVEEEEGEEEPEVQPRNLDEMDTSQTAEHEQHEAEPAGTGMAL